jgi:hypothetical protein
MFAVGFTFVPCRFFSWCFLVWSATPRPTLSPDSRYRTPPRTGHTWRIVSTARPTRGAPATMRPSTTCTSQSVRVHFAAVPSCIGLHVVPTCPVTRACCHPAVACLARSWCSVSAKVRVPGDVMYLLPTQSAPECLTTPVQVVHAAMCSHPPPLPTPLPSPPHDGTVHAFILERFPRAVVLENTLFGLGDPSRPPSADTPNPRTGSFEVSKFCPRSQRRVTLLKHVEHIVPFRKKKQCRGREWCERW